MEVEPRQLQVAQQALESSLLELDKLLQGEFEFGGSAANASTRSSLGSNFKTPKPRIPTQKSTLMKRQSLPANIRHFGSQSKVSQERTLVVSGAADPARKRGRPRKTQMLQSGDTTLPRPVENFEAKSSVSRPGQRPEVAAYKSVTLTKVVNPTKKPEVKSSMLQRILAKRPQLEIARAMGGGSTSMTRSRPLTLTRTKPSLAASSSPTSQTSTPTTWHRAKTSTPKASSSPVDLESLMKKYHWISISRAPQQDSPPRATRHQNLTGRGSKSGLGWPRVTITQLLETAEDKPSKTHNESKKKDMERFQARRTINKMSAAKIDD